MISGGWLINAIMLNSFCHCFVDVISLYFILQGMNKIIRTLSNFKENLFIMELDLL